MSTIDYSSPVDKLLTFGKPEPKNAQNWPDYLELGIGPEHIPDLLRMVADAELWEAEQESPENWAPVHAWRTFGQLRAVEAVEPLLHLFEERGSDDWAIDELPQVYGLIGAPAIPIIEAYVADKSHEKYAGIAEEGLNYIVQRYPDTRAEVVATLTRLLENFAENDYEINGFLISSLVKLKELDALPLIERAFAADRVDTFITGDWDNVQVDLGLKEAPPEPPFSLPSLFERRRRPISPDQFEIISPDMQEIDNASTPSQVTRSDEIETAASHTMATPNPRYFETPSEHKASHKSKNKMAKQSRKKNKKRR